MTTTETTEALNTIYVKVLEKLTSVSFLYDGDLEDDYAAHLRCYIDGRTVFEWLPNNWIFI